MTCPTPGRNHASHPALSQVKGAFVVRESDAVQRRHFLQVAASATALSSGFARAGADDRRALVIDTHLHCFAGKDYARFPYAPDGPYQPADPATPEHLLKCMAEAGVDHAVVVEPKTRDVFCDEFPVTMSG